MIQSVCILGRQPEIGLAELESLYGQVSVTRLSDHAVGLMLDPHQVDFMRLGGSTRFAGIVGEIPSTDWKQVEKGLVAFARSTAFVIPTSGKFHLGLSAYGFDISAAKLNALGLTIKKVVRTRHDGSVRLAPNNETELSTAQVIHNNLVGPNGAELLIIAGANKTYLAKTISVQDIASYTLRDRGRPKRDARVGMLPPKLAQIIINLAAGTAEPHAYVQDNTALSRPQVLDPFCGTGVILQEALLTGFRCSGTDLEPRMAAYSRENIDWLLKTCHLPAPMPEIAVGDATSCSWQQTIDFVACETYLGRPFTSPPSREILEKTVREVDTIIRKFLRNIHPQLSSGTRLCVAVPAWSLDGQYQRSTDKFRHLPTLDQLTELGYNQVRYIHAPQNLIYHRDGQVVGRELVTLVRN